MAEIPVLRVHTDGASRGNPGEAAWAYVIEGDGREPVEEADVLGPMTNNQAEYVALVRALEHALELGPGCRVVVHSDSELMVKQLNGEYRVRKEELLPLFEQAKGLIRRFPHGVVVRHVRREQNQRADQLCNEALDGFRSSVRGLVPSAPPAKRGTPEPAGLHAEAVACLRQAARAWRQGQGDEPEEVWRRLAAILARHGQPIPPPG
jgi:ribonuclease HI